MKKQNTKGKKVSEKAAEKKKEEDKPTCGSAAPPSVPDGGATSSAEPSSTAADSVDKDASVTTEDKDAILESETPSEPGHGRQPSTSVQSKIRSSSFRRTSIPSTPLSPTTNGIRPPNLPALSPDGDAVTEIYRKQAFRLDELEKENKKLSREVEVAENRWRKTEEELEELREDSGQVTELKSRADKADAKTEEINRLVPCPFRTSQQQQTSASTDTSQASELASLQRQYSHLQSITSKPARHGPLPSQAGDRSDLLAQIDSKSSTIESMEMEISNLRAHIAKNVSAVATFGEQVNALKEKLDRAERAAGAAQRELLDVRKNLDRASEKAVKEGSERTSAETRIRSLTREAEEKAKSAEESMRRVNTLEKKLAALTTLHKESDARRQNGERERERAEKETGELRKRIVGVENENLRLKEERDRLKKRCVAGGGADEGLDELEDEERKRLEGKVRELDGKIFDLRRGVWKEKKELRGGDEDELGSPGGFDEVDLSGPSGPTRRQSLKPGRGPGQAFANVLSSGFSAFTGAERPSLDLGDDDMGFDEDAFRLAQEEEGRKRIERIKEVKRGLKDWEGWRMDIVDIRIGGRGAGEIFDV